MSVQADRREPVLLDTQGILVKGQAYRAVLTGGAIILTGESDHTQRSIGLQEVWKIERDTDPSGDPAITLSIPSAGGMVHSIILHFPLRTFPNAFRLRDLWASEINRLLQLSMPGARPVISGEVRPEPLFCSRCGNLLAVASVFCSRCGARVPSNPRHQIVSGDNRRGHKPGEIPNIRLDSVELPPSGRLPSSVTRLRDREKIPVVVAHGKDPRKKQTLFASSVIKKPAVIVGVVLVAIFIIAAALMMTAPSGSHMAKPASPDQKFPLPVLGDVAMPTIPIINTASGQEIVGSPAIPQEASLSEATTTRSALTLVPGDPGELLSKYPSLFNSVDGAGFQPLLSENMKIQHPADRLNTELETARTKGYSINTIQVTAQSVDEETADVITSIFWNIGGSSFTSSPRIFFVYEDSQWKLDSLVLSPDDS